ncbi:MAG: PQQ-binding-like beta-propeller repeat protein [Acidobacteriota bacterium]
MSRLVPGLRLRLFLVLPLGLVLWLRMADPLGDRGLANVLSAALLILDALAASAWLLFFSGYARRTRMKLAVGGCLLLAALGLCFRLEGYTGELVPTFAWRFREEPARLAEEVGPNRAGSLRLARTDLDLRTTSVNDFPGFLGPHRDAHVEGVRLSRHWDTDPPRPVWRRAVGAGWSAFSVVNGYAVTMEQRGQMEMVTAYDARRGELMWAFSQPGRYEHVLGGVGPRSTPTIADGKVYALGATGRLWCLDGATGELIWEKDLLKEYGVSPEQEFANIQYGRSNSPLVAGDLLVVPAGGNKGGRIASLVAYRKDTGRRVWEAGQRQISFSSPVLATLLGVEQILIVNEDTISSHHPATGSVLWEHPWPGVTSSNANVSQAVPVAPDGVLVSKGYGGGAERLQLIRREDGTFAVRVVWRSRGVLRTKFSNVVVLDDHVYGLSDGILECVDLETGRRVWKRGRYHHGQILGVGDLLLVLSESGEVFLVEPTPSRANHILGHFQALEGITWNNIALSGNLLLVRNAHEAGAYRLPLAHAGE